MKRGDREGDKKEGRWISGIEETQRSARDIEAAQAYLQSLKKADVILQETVEAGKKLLNDLVSEQLSIVLHPEQVQIALELLLTNTEFEGVKVVNRGEATPEYWRQYPIYKGMDAILGDYPKNAYNIWFQRLNGKWILNFNTVPKSGNWRGVQEPAQD